MSHIAAHKFVGFNTVYKDEKAFALPNVKKLKDYTTGIASWIAKGQQRCPFQRLPASSELHRQEASAVPGSASGSGAANPRSPTTCTCS
ncbi:hypothetical protein EAO24_17770 [Klebsiella pneumoniae]|nr:hypothetical protein EAO24_17770 [Klebsiella pneumoniae]